MAPHWDLQNVESEVSSSVKDPFLALFNVYCYVEVIQVNCCWSSFLAGVYLVGWCLVFVLAYCG